MQCGKVVSGRGDDAGKNDVAKKGMHKRNTRGKKKKSVCGRAVSYEFMNEFRISCSSNAKIKISNRESQIAR